MTYGKATAKGCIALYNDTVPTEISDRIFFSSPIAIGRQIGLYHLHEQVRTDSARFDALERAGFKLERFGDILYHVNERAGGHYIDIGTSAKISAGLVRYPPLHLVKRVFTDALLFVMF